MNYEPQEKIIGELTDNSHSTKHINRLSALVQKTERNANVCNMFSSRTLTGRQGTSNFAKGNLHLQRGT